MIEARKNIVREILDLPPFGEVRVRRLLAAYPSALGRVKEDLAFRIMRELLGSLGLPQGAFLKAFQGLDHVLEGVGERRHFIHQFEAFLLGLTFLSKILVDLRKSPGEIRSAYQDWMCAALLHDVCKPAQHLSKLVAKIEALVVAQGIEVAATHSGAGKPAVRDPEVEELLCDELTCLTGSKWVRSPLPCTPPATPAGGAMVLDPSKHGALAAEWFYRLANSVGYDSQRRNRIMGAMAIHDIDPKHLGQFRDSWNHCEDSLGALLLACDYLQDWERDPVRSDGGYVEQILEGFRWIPSKKEFEISYIYRWGKEISRDYVINKIVNPKRIVASVLRDYGSPGAIQVKLSITTRVEGTEEKLEDIILFIRN